jgi:hypothetical protein
MPTHWNRAEAAFDFDLAVRAQENARRLLHELRPTARAPAGDHEPLGRGIKVVKRQGANASLVAAKFASTTV